MEKEIKKFFDLQYKELQENIFYKQNKKVISKEIDKIKFGKYHEGPIEHIDLKYFLPLIAEFFKTYYMCDNFLESIDKQIFIYERQEIIDYINAYHKRDYKKIVNSRLELPVTTSYLLLTTRGLYICPIEQDEYEIHISNEKDLNTVFDIVHEFTHKLHYDVSLSYGDEIWDIISEALATYNEYLFSLYLKDKISGYSIDLAMEQIDQNRQFEFYYRKIFEKIYEKKKKVDLTEEDKTNIIYFYDTDYFPLSDFSHHIGYALYQKYLQEDKDLNIEEMVKKISLRMKDNRKNLKEILK